MIPPRIKARQRFSEPFVQKFEKNLQMACVLCKLFETKEENPMQKGVALAPSVIELFSRFDEENIDLANLERSPWQSGVKHVDELSDRLLEIMKKWRKVAKYRGFWEKTEASEKKRLIKAKVESIQNLNCIEYTECKSLQEEALCVLLKTKKLLQNSDKTKIAIISDNPQLNKIILSLSKLFDIKIANHYGVSFKEIEHIDFLRLMIETVRQNFAPMHLLALLRHKLFALNTKDFDLNYIIQELERKYLRGVRRYETLGELIELISENQLKIFLWLLQEEFKTFITLMSQTSVPFQYILKEASNLAACIASPSQTSIYKELSEILVDSGNISPEFFIKMFDSLIENKRLCLTSVEEQTSVSIFSLADSAATHCDYIIITCLNEETFFKNRSYDLRTINSTYESLGLRRDDPEFEKTETAFTNLVQNKNVLLTRASVVGGAPQTPSRLLIKLELMAKKLKIKNFYNTDLQQKAASFYTPSEFSQLAPPAPAPPPEKRLKKLSVTQIENLIRDPYSVYARYILDLHKLEQIDKPLTQLEFGNFVHKVINGFSKHYIRGKNKDCYFKEVMTFGRLHAAKMIKNPIVKNIWLVQLKKIANWIIKFEAIKRDKETKVKIYTETRGMINIPLQNADNFVLSCYADRIELDENNKATIIDFKTGSAPPKKEVLEGTSPQLPLEALILLEGGFEDIPKSRRTKINIHELAYITLSAGMKFGNIISFKENLDTLIYKIQAELKELLAFYKKETTPFLVCPDSERASIYNDYSHLERLEELSFYNK